MKRIASIIAAICLAVSTWAGVYTVESVPNVHKADREQFVADPDNFVPAAYRDSINVALKNVRQTSSAEVMVVVVGDYSDEYADFNDFANKLFEYWGLGKQDKDNGLLILAVMDRHEAVIRTGRGMEGLLPDPVCSRIFRQIIAPNMKEGRTGEALLGAVKVVQEILTRPDAVDEILSKAADADNGNGEEEVSGFQIYLGLSAILAVFMLVLVLVALASLKGKSDHHKYNKMVSWRDPMLIFTFLGIGLPSVATIPLLLLLNHWRNHTRYCPNCKARMERLDEQSDNAYLTPAQDLEEQIGSVDYDVWLCAQCNETDILPYVNHNDKHVECEICHARTAHLVKARVLRKPTATEKGRGIKIYECKNCHGTFEKPYDIDPTGGDGGAALVAGAVIGSALSGGRGGGGFSGPIGGGFGGGRTFGGGAGGRW